MSERGAIWHEGVEIPYSVTRSRRRKKTLQLSVDGTARVVVAAPVHVSPRDIEAFVQKRASWVSRRRAEVAVAAQSPQFLSGEALPYLGRPVPLVVDEVIALPRPQVHFDESTFTVNVPAGLPEDERMEATREACLRWYRQQAATRLQEAVWHWASLIGYEPARILVRDQKRRWGSCSADGTLRFNWRAVLVEPGLLDYIVVHELAHLAVRNHSPAFWAVVTKAMPDARQRRTRLREAGATLQL